MNYPFTLRSFRFFISPPKFLYTHIYAFVTHVSSKLAVDCEVEERSWVNTCSIVSRAAASLGERNYECTAADWGLSFSNCFCLSFLPSLPAGPNQALIRPSPTLIIHDVTSTSQFFCFSWFFSPIPSAAATLDCLLNINRCWRWGRGGGIAEFGPGSPVPRPSICSSAAITTSASVLTSPGLFVHLYLCFFPLLFLWPPRLSAFQWREAEEWSVRLWCRWPLPWVSTAHEPGQLRKRS